MEKKKVEFSNGNSKIYLVQICRILFKENDQLSTMIMYSGGSVQNVEAVLARFLLTSSYAAPDRAFITCPASPASSVANS